MITVTEYPSAEDIARDIVVNEVVSAHYYTGMSDSVMLTFHHFVAICRYFYSYSDPHEQIPVKIIDVTFPSNIVVASSSIARDESILAYAKKTWSRHIFDVLSVGELGFKDSKSYASEMALSALSELSDIRREMEKAFLKEKMPKKRK